jgi:dipeptidyl aminopeptidase/acylaminoacyl peptidase
MNILYKQFIRIFILSGLLATFACQAVPSVDDLDFFAMPDMVIAKISPDGKSIVALKYQKTQQQLILIDAVTKEEILLLDLQGVYKENASVSKLLWIDDQHIAVQLAVTRKGIEDLLDTKSSQRLLIIKKTENKQPPKIFSVRTKGWLVHPLPAERGVFLYAKSGLYSKVYKISVNALAIEGKKLNKLSKVDGGQFKTSNEVKRTSGYAIRWFFDTQGSPKAVLHYDEKGALILSSYSENEKATVLKAWPNEIEQDASIDSDVNEKKLLPLEYAGNNDSFYCLDLNEEEKRTVYLVDYKTGQEKKIYEADSYEIIGLEISQKTEKLTSIKVINNGVVERVFINDLTVKNLTSSKLLNSVINTSLEDDKTIVYRESHTNPGQFYLQSATGSMLIGEKYPHLKNKLFSHLIESTVNVEGLEIPYLLSLPTKTDQPYPLVVMPHGGPIGVYDKQYYDAVVQFLTSKGNAVLQVNFRGSSGYSSELKAAGKNQWANLMLKDIHQATLVVSERLDIASQKICTFGMSYGGYAALMLTSKYPQMYKCAASWAGVTDLNLYVNNPRLTKNQKQWIREHVGVIDWSYEQLKANSPVFQIESLKAPVFIAHGRKDKIVDIENAFRMKLMLEKYNKDYLWYEDEEGTHSFGSVVQRKAYFSQLDAFLTNHLH